MKAKLLKSERNSSYLGQYWKHKKGRPHFGNGRTWGILWLLSLEIKTTFKSSCILSCFVGHPVHGEEDRGVFGGGAIDARPSPAMDQYGSIVLRGFDFWDLNGCWAPRPLKRKTFQYFICICITNKFFQQLFDRSVTYIKKIVERTWKINVKR